MVFYSGSGPSAPLIPGSYRSDPRYDNNPNQYSYNRPPPLQQQGSFHGGYATSSSSAYYGYGSGEQQPGVDPELIRVFQMVDRDRSGFIEAAELQQALSVPESIFERFDKDRSGKMDATELRDALLSLGYAVPPSVLHLLLSYVVLALGWDACKGFDRNVQGEGSARNGSISFSRETMFTLFVILHRFCVWNIWSCFFFCNKEKKNVKLSACLHNVNT